MQGNLSALFATKGDSDYILSHFREKYMPLDEYKRNLGVSDSLVLLSGFQSVSSSTDSDESNFFAVYGSDLVPVSEDEYIRLREKSIADNLTLIGVFSRRLDIPTHFISV